MGLAGEQITITITGTSTSAVAAAEKTSASLAQIGVAAKRASAESMAASLKLQRAGSAIAGVGKSLTKYVTLPMVGIGVASVKMSADFHRSMRMVSTQAGGTSKEVAKLSKAVLDLAQNQSDFSPKELADALFHIESVGIRGAKALATLKASANLADVGNADLEKTTYALVSALETGIKGTENLHKSIGTLNAIVGTGDMRLEDLAEALSSGVLVSAKQVGLSLRDTGAALDLMTARGMPAQVAATRLRMTFTLMAAPTEKAADAFKRIGLDSDALAKKMAQPNGLVKAITTLKEHMQGLSKIEQTQLLSEAFGGARSGTTMMALVQNLDDLKQRYAQVGKSASGFNRQIRETNAEPLERLNQAWNSIRVSMIELGDALIPAVVPALEHVAGAISDVSTAFAALPPGAKETVVTFGLIAAAAGPVLVIAGSLIRNVGVVVGWLGRFGAGSAVAAEGQAALLASIEATNAGLVQQRELLIANSSGVVTGSVPVGGAAPATAGRFSGLLGKAGRGLAIGAGATMAGSMIGGRAGNLVSKVGQGAAVGSMFGLPGAAVGASVGAVVADVELLTGAEKKLAPFQLKLANSSKEITHWLKEQHQASKGLTAATGGVDAAHRRQAKTADDVKSAEHKLTSVRQQFGPLSKPAVRAEYELADARHHNEQAIKRVQNAERLKGQALQMYKAVTRSTMAEERHRIHLLQEQRDNLSQLFHKEQFAGASQQRLAQVGKQGLKVLGALKDEQKKYAQVLGDSSAKAGEKWTKHMKALPTYLLAFGKEVDAFAPKLSRLGDNPGPKKLAAAFQDMNQRVGNLMGNLSARTDKLRERNEAYERQTQLLPRSVVRSWGLLGKAMLQNAGKGEGAVKKTTAAQDKLRAGAASDLPKAATAYKDFAKESSSALADLGGNFNAFLEAFKQKPVDFSVSAQGGKAESKRAGGGFIGGLNRRDHVHALLGSKEAVLNVHQQPEVQTGLAVAKSMGLARHGSLQELFGGVTTPNHLAAGGFASKVPREVLHGPGPLVPAGQKGLDEARGAGLDYLKKHMGPRPGLGRLDGHPVSEWIIPILEWARGHGWGGSVTSGYRTPAEQIAAATAYGLGHYGAGGPLGSNHVKINYPGGAVDVSAAAALAAALKGYPGKPNLVWGGPVMGDYVHFSATGHARGGFAGAPLAFSTGGPVPPKGGELVGASYYGGPTDGTSGTVGSAGVSLPGKMAFAELAMGKALGGLPYHSKLKVGYAGNSVIAEKLDIGAGGDDVGGHNRAIDLWYEAAQAIKMPGTAVVRVAPASGSATAKEEKVPAVFHGAKTGGLTFGAVPKTLHGVKRELGKRVAEIGRYRHAVKAAKGKPKVEQALSHNVTALEGRIRQLRRQASLLRRQAAKRKITKRLSKQLAKLTGKEAEIEGKGRAFEIASQTAEQIVDLEPQPPELGPDVSEADREKAEKAFVERLRGYVDGTERPAYEGLLDRAADWRTTILSGEAKATALEHGWEGGVRKTDNEIDQINEFTKKVSGDVHDWRAKHPKAKHLPDWLQAEVKKMHDERARLPVLRFRDRELRNVLGQGREVFWGGVKNPVAPPSPPLPGTGSFEEVLQQVQGIHWPDEHGRIDKLPAARAAGRFGGVIWDVQRAIAELDLKVSSAAGSVGGGGGGAGEGGGDDLKEMREELEAQRSRERTAAAQLTAANLTELTGFLSEFRSQLPYVGAFATGGVVPGPMGRPGWAVVHGGEEVLRADQGGGSPVVIHLHGDMADLVEAQAAGMVQTVDRRLGRNSRTLAFAPGV